MRRIVQIRIGAALLLLTLALVYKFGGALWVPVYYKLVSKRTVSEALEQFGPAARERLAQRFDAAGVAYPSQRIALLAFKDTRRLELYADGERGWVFVRAYPIQGASGNPGPKLKEGDLQVPEGIYGIEGLNPNSAFHLSMKVNYPNAFDRTMAQRDGRTNLGGDIFIHGATSSIGCLAMGDEAIEELFTLAADISVKNVHIVIAPCDLRTTEPATPDGTPAWLPDLYDNVQTELHTFPHPEAIP